MSKKFFTKHIYYWDYGSYGGQMNFENEYEEDLDNGYTLNYGADSNIEKNLKNGTTKIEGAFELYKMNDSIYRFFDVYVTDLYNGSVKIDLEFDSDEWKLQSKTKTVEEILDEAGLTMEELNQKVDDYLSKKFLPSIEKELTTFFDYIRE